MPRQNKIQFRKGTYSQWDANSTIILASGEPGFATDLNILKIGDGIKQWSDLPAVNDNLITVVRNDTGSTISKMSVVYISGAQGDTPRIALALANGEPSSSKTYGLVVNDILTANTGTVVVDGTLRNLDTNTQFSALNEGTALWLSPTISGGLTSIKPYAPNHSVFVGTLIRKHSQQGIINVKIQNGYELEELHNVATTGVSNGQFLQYNSSSGLWVPSSSGNFIYVSGTDGLFSNLYVNTAKDTNKVNLNNKLTIDGDNFLKIYGVNDGLISTEDDTIYGFAIGGSQINSTDIGQNLPALGTFTDLASTNLIVDNGSGTIFVSSISGTDPVTISSSTASMIINDITIFLQNNTHVDGYLRLNNATADTIAIFNNDKDVVSLTSPTLTELSYISGVSSNVQTQLDSKQAILTNPVTGTGVANHIPYWSSTSGLLADSSQLVWDSTNNRLGIGTSNPSASLHLVGSGIVSGDVTIGGNLTVNGTTTIINVDTVTIEDPILTLGLSSGNIVPSLTYDRGLALVRGTGLTAFMGWDTSANEFILLSSGVVGANSGTYTAGTYGNLRSNSFIKNGGTSSQFLKADGSVDSTSYQSSLTNPVTGVGISGYLTKWISGSTISSGIIYDNGTNIGIGTTNPGYKLQVSGSFGATTKSFRIDHPSKPGFSLEYGSLESPYHGVRLTGRGKVIKGIGIVQLPDYLKDLIHNDESLTIQLTNYKHGKILYIKDIDLDNNQFTVKADRCKTLGELEFFWSITGTRKDVENLVVEKRN